MILWKISQKKWRKKQKELNKRANPRMSKQKNKINLKIRNKRKVTNKSNLGMAKNQSIRIYDNLWLNLKNKIYSKAEKLLLFCYQLFLNKFDRLLSYINKGKKILY